MKSTDVVVIGGGIIGLATAMTLQQRFSDIQVTVLEAEREVANHQSGHNSGVLHSGIYYKPGSKKAINCRAGKQAMQRFCDEHAVAWERCGKVVVATSDEQMPQLERIAQRAISNGVEFDRLDADGLREMEPFATGVAALHVPETGIVNFGDVCRVLSKVILAQGGTIRLNFGVQKIRSLGSSLELSDAGGTTLRCDRLINCAGLQSDRVFAMAGGKPSVRIIPFRGEYYELVPQRESLCRNLIYPVPDPSFPFLGVHFTRMIDGGVECGPNAVLAFSRSGYRWRTFNLRDVADTFAFGGFRSLAAKHWRMGLGEMHRSLSKSAFVAELQKLIPSIRSEELKVGRTGVRAQAVTTSGDLVDDFLFAESERAIHVLNAPSPAATASLAIAQDVVRRFAGDDG